MEPVYNGTRITALTALISLSLLLMRRLCESLSSPSEVCTFNQTAKFATLSLSIPVSNETAQTMAANPPGSQRAPQTHHYIPSQPSHDTENTQGLESDDLTLTLVLVYSHRFKH